MHWQTRAVRLWRFNWIHTIGTGISTHWARSTSLDRTEATGIGAGCHLPSHPRSLIPLCTCCMCVLGRASTRQPPSVLVYPFTARLLGWSASLFFLSTCSHTKELKMKMTRLPINVLMAFLSAPSLMLSRIWLETIKCSGNYNSVFGYSWKKATCSPSASTYKEYLGARLKWFLCLGSLKGEDLCVLK